MSRDRVHVKDGVVRMKEEVEEDRENTDTSTTTYPGVSKHVSHERIFGRVLFFAAVYTARENPATLRDTLATLSLPLWPWFSFLQLATEDE